MRNTENQINYSFGFYAPDNENWKFLANNKKIKFGIIKERIPDTKWGKQENCVI